MLGSYNVFDKQNEHDEISLEYWSKLVYQWKFFNYYTPGIYAEGYIVFVFPFVCSFVLSSVVLVEFRAKFYVKVSEVGYIPPSTQQKAFIFGP